MSRKAREEALIHLIKVDDLGPDSDPTAHFGIRIVYMYYDAERCIDGKVHPCVVRHDDFNAHMALCCLPCVI
jgi:hypothetical protein